jgi:hypothetical protein
MKMKTLNLLFASVFAMVFLMAFASATITLTSSTSTLSQTGGSFSVTVASNENETVNLTMPSISDGFGKVITFTLVPTQVIINTVTNPSSVVTVNYVVESGFNFEFAESYSSSLSAVGNVSSQATKAFKFEGSDFCEFDNKGNLKVSIEDITVMNGFGDDNEWFLFDEVEVEVLIENSGNEDIENIVIEWGLYNTQSKEWTIKLNEEDEIDVNEDDEETIILSFTLNDKMDEDLKDLESGDYVIYVRATGEISAGTYEGDDSCASDSETVSLITEKDFVVLSNLDVPETVQCDSEVIISGDVWNIGSRDQNDVTVEIYNSELGLNKIVEIGDIDSFESSDFDFTFQLPENVQEKSYKITLTVYDEDDDIYQNGNDDESISTVLLTVQGNCDVKNKALVSAVLESGGEAGKVLVVRTTITNTGSKTASFSLNAAGYTGWASLATLDKTSLTLDAGKSEDVLLKFNVNRDAIGEKMFTFEVLSENELIVNQPVQVDITKKKWGITGNFFSGDNKYIWGIGLLNLILIILIIVIAVRIARK